MEIGFQILDFIQSWRQPWLDEIMIFFSGLGDGGILWITATLLLLFYKPTRRLGIACALSLLLSLLFCNLIMKPIFQRPRPFALRELELLIEGPQDGSFPSGHSCSSFAFAATLAFMKRKSAWIAAVFAALIAFSRLYLQVHFPGDVLAGAVLGCFCGFLAKRLLALLEKRWTEKKAK